VSHLTNGVRDRAECAHSRDYLSSGGPIQVTLAISLCRRPSFSMPENLEEKATRVFNSGEGFSIPSYSTARRVIESDKVSKHTS
jgi:hypothetical protein